MVVASLVALAVLFGLLAGLAAFLVRQHREARQQQQDKPDADDSAEEAPGPARRGGVDRMRAGRLRQRRVQQQHAAAAARGRGGSDSENEGSADDGDEQHETWREAQRRERAQAREAERLAREARANKVSAYDERRRKREEEREARELAQEAEVAAAAAERQRQEDEEAAKWMNMINVEEEGTAEAASTSDAQGLLAAFVTYIQDRKMAPIEEIATTFGLRSSEVIDRIHGLEALGRLTGVMDERGKYIFVSEPEMHTVADFIRTRGRIAISELAARSSDLIDLEPKASMVGACGPGQMLAFDDVLGAGEV